MLLTFSVLLNMRLMILNLREYFTICEKLYTANKSNQLFMSVLVLASSDYLSDD